jgi:hypothetical protein
MFLGAAPQLLQVAIEALDLSEEPDIERILVEHTDRILGIHSRHQDVLGIPDGAQMARGNIAAHTDHCKVFWHRTHISPDIEPAIRAASPINEQNAEL